MMVYLIQLNGIKRNLYASSFMHFDKNEYECLNELIPNILSSCKENNISEIYGLDGGSTDGTIDIYNKYGIKYFSQKVMAGEMLLI